MSRFKLHELHCAECKKPTGEQGLTGDFAMCSPCRERQKRVTGEDWPADVIIRDMDAPGQYAKPWQPGMYSDDYEG